VRGAFARVNQRLYEWAVAQDLRGDTGTTLTLVVCTDEEVAVGNVGDSRAYLIRGDEVRRLTEDHSWVAEQVRLGHLTEEEAARSPLRNQLTQAVGVDPVVDPHLVTLPLEPGCVFLACTDGLTEVVDADAMGEVVRAGSAPEDLCAALVALAVAADATDNVTVAALSTGPLPVAAPVEPPEVVSDEEAPPEPPAPSAEDQPAAAESEPLPEAAGVDEGAAPAPEEDVHERAARATAEEQVEVTEQVPVRGGDGAVARQRSRRLLVLLVVALVSLALGLWVGRATLGPGEARAPATGAATEKGAGASPSEATPAAGGTPTATTPEGFVIRVKCEGDALVVSCTEPVSLLAYPWGKASEGLTSVQGDQPNETRFQLPETPPDSWQGQTVTLKIERLGEGRLKLTPGPEVPVYVDKHAHEGKELLALTPAKDPARIGFRFPAGDDPKAYGIAILDFPVSGQ